MVTDDNIRGFLYDIEKEVSIDWKCSFLKWSNIADECNKTFSKIHAILRFREDEKKKRSKIISPGALLEEIEKNSQYPRDNYPGDLFYYPGDFINHNNEVIYYDNDLAAKNLMEILNIDPNTFRANEKPFELPSDPLTLKCYSLALKKAFYMLVQGNVIPYKIVSYLYSVLFDIYHESERRWDDTLKQEKQREQNSRNQKKSTQKEQRIEALKLHPKYPELAETIEKYLKTGKGRDQRTLNALITEITGIEHPTTRKIYREIILREYTESKKLQ
jgi:vacuolar-type H+-ATPase subunit I/STV1